MKKFYVIFLLITGGFNITFALQDNAGIRYNSCIDSLLTLLKKDKDDTNKINHLNKLSKEWLSISSYDTSLYYANFALQLSSQLSFEKGISSSLNTIGSIYTYTSDYPKALDYFQRCLKFNISNKRGVAASLGNIGSVYTYLSDYPKALEYYFKSLKIDEEIENKQGIASSINNIGIIYLDLSDYPQALNYFIRSLKVCVDKDDIANALDNIGIVYLHLSEYPKALEYHFKGLKIREEIGDKRGIAASLDNIGNVYEELSDYPKALEYHLRSLKTGEEIGYKLGVAASMSNISNVYLKLKQYAFSLQYSTNAIHLLTETGNLSYEKDVQYIAYQACKAMNNNAQALEHFERFVVLHDSIYKDETRRQIMYKQMSYEFDKKEAFAKLEQEKKDIEQATHNKQQATLLNIFIGAFVMVALLVVISVVAYRQRIRSNALIALKNEEISRQSANIAGREVERKRISEELHDGIGGTLAAIKLNLVRINSNATLITPELDSIISNLADACKEVRTISHNLALPALDAGSFVSVISDMVRKFIIPDKLNINLEFSSPLDMEKIPGSIKADIYRIIQELLTNITKHAAATKVEIEFSKQENDLFLLVEDNGTGFDVTEAKRGIGLRNIESRIKLHGGEVNIDSKINRGTAINIHIPLSDITRNKTTA
ncbi:MAG: sensor histidine kinase [Bacteroidetes bacterium]|nr:sensor histidine kinase [Bacteroidota bacterium]